MPPDIYRRETRQYPSAVNQLSIIARIRRVDARSGTDQPEPRRIHFRFVIVEASPRRRGIFVVSLASSSHAAPKEIRAFAAPFAETRRERIHRHEVGSPQGRRISAAAEGNARAEPADAESSRKALLSRNLRRTLAGRAAASAGAKVLPASSFREGEHERVQAQTPNESPYAGRMIIGKFR